MRNMNTETPTTLVRKPVEVPAIYFNGNNVEEVREFLGAGHLFEKGKHKKYILNGVDTAERGWIVLEPGKTPNFYTQEEMNRDFVVSMGAISDGYHTFHELYNFRMLYNALSFNLGYQTGVIPQIQKSLKHADGELCFGGGWFVVIAILPDGQISNHYPIEFWDLFQIPDVEVPTIEFDGHTPEDVVVRMDKFLRKNFNLVDHFSNIGGVVCKLKDSQLDGGLGVKLSRGVATIMNTVENLYAVKRMKGRAGRLDMIYYEKAISECLNLNNSLNQMTDESK
jgi:hypothetical protein